VATYHGITELECLTCGYVTNDDYTMEIINDTATPCQCGSSFWLWSNTNDSQIVSSGIHARGGLVDSRGWYLLVDGEGE
jgi:hypothetical protein